MKVILWKTINALTFQSYNNKITHKTTYISLFQTYFDNSNNPHSKHEMLEYSIQTIGKEELKKGIEILVGILTELLIM